MALPREPSVTAEPGANASAPAFGGGAGGVWTLDGGELIALNGDGPATVLVPTEAVLLLAVDLPVAGRAKRLAALPYAVEDRIAEPLEAVHLALGAEIAPKRFLVGVIRHDRMVEWISRIEDARLDHAALVPDALALPVPGAGEWAVDLGANRAVVRAGDGTGLAVPASLLTTAWTAAGRPRAMGYGAPLPAEMAGDAAAMALEPLAVRLLSPPLDLRQGRYARVRRTVPGFGRRLAQIAAIGALAHTGIAAADTLMMRAIADRRADETRALVATMAPGTTLPADDFAAGVADLLPTASTSGSNPFLGTAARIGAALAPLGPTITTRSITFAGGTTTMAVDSTDPGAPARISTALRDAGIAATVNPTPADGILIVANAP